MRRLIRLTPLVLLILGLLFFRIPRTSAQAPPGYAKIASVTATTYTDTTCADGATCLYVVTATNAVGESGPSNVISLTIPATGTHTEKLTWAAGAGGGVPTGYNVYQESSSVPPVALTGVVN